MSDYDAIKYAHLTCVVLSGCGFLLRGVWSLTGSPRLKHPPTRVLPHVVDTFLLLTAPTLAFLSGQLPGATGRVNAKVAGLVVYVLLGTIAPKRGKTQAQKASAFGLAIASFLFIVSVALTKDPLGAFGLLRR